MHRATRKENPRSAVEKHLLPYCMYIHPLSPLSILGSDWRRLFRVFYFRKAELLVDFFVGFAVDFDIGVDEVIQRRAILLRRQHDVASRRELHAIGVNCAEEIIFL